MTEMRCATGRPGRVHPLSFAMYSVLLGTLLQATAAQAPPLVPADAEVDVRYPFMWVPRDGHTLAYDARRKRTVMFGGTAHERACPTMEWDGEYWRGVWTTNTPNVAVGHAMVYDAARGVTVLFGGMDVAGYRPYSKENRLSSTLSDGGAAMDETWLYDGTNWTQAQPATSPPARAFHAMAYDTVSQRVLLYGGTSEPGQEDDALDDSYLKDFWAWDGTTWTELGGVPPDMPALKEHGMACDTNRGVTVLFGGWKYALVESAYWADRWRAVYHTNTWEWNGTAWTNAAPAGSPPSYLHYANSLAYDSHRQRVVALSERGPDTYYTYDGTTWTASGVGGGAMPGWTSPFAYHAAKQHIVAVPEERSDEDADVSASRIFDGTAWRAAGFYPYQYGSPGYQPLLWTDYSGDGRPDALVGGFGPNGDSNGYTAAVASFPLGASGFDHRPRSIMRAAGYVAALADIDGDGLDDLALGGEEKLWVFGGEADGAFSGSPVWSKTVNDKLVRDVAWPDVDGDGRPDLAVLHRAPFYGAPKVAGVIVYRNNGDKPATSPFFSLSFPDLTVGYGCMAWDDLNRDGSVDLALSLNENPSAVRVYTNDGAGTLSLDTILPGYEGALEIADINDDWWPDLVGPLFAYANNRGTFALPPSWMADELDSVDLDQLKVETGDVDGDGDTDVAVFRRGNPGIEAYLYRNDAGALTATPVWSSDRRYEDCTPGALGDADADGDLDVATPRGVFLLDPRWHTTRLPLEAPLWLRSDVDPADPAKTRVEWDPVVGSEVAGYRVYNIRPADRLDEILPATDLIAELSPAETHIVTDTSEAAEVHVATMDRAGREYGPAGSARVEALAPTNSTQDRTIDFWWDHGDAFPGDIDGDGDLDLVVEHTSPHPIASRVRTSWLLYTNNGSGIFAVDREWRQSENDADLHGPGRARLAAMGDITGDGLPDLVGQSLRIVAGTNGVPEDRLFLDVYTNAGGTFALDPDWNPMLPGSRLRAYEDFAWGDIDGTNGLDLLVCELGGVVLFLNEGGMLADPRVWTSSVTRVDWLAPGDVDGDGRDDLAVANDAAMHVWVYRGTASGIEETPSWSHASGIDGEARRLTWADFDGDGDADLTVHGYERSLLRNHPTVLYRNDNGNLTYLCVYKSRNYKGGAGVGIGDTSGWADMDNDGDLDLWGDDLILEAAAPTFNAGPIGDEPDYWHGHAGEEGWGRHPPFSDVQGVYDFNGDGTPDFLMGGAEIMLRTPDSIYQADYVRYVPNTNSTPLESGQLKLYPEGPILLDGPGATQAIAAVMVKPDLSEVPIPYDSALLEFTIYGNSESDPPYVTLSNNVLTAVRNGTVMLSVQYGDWAHEFPGSPTAAGNANKSIRIENAPWLTDLLAVTPSDVTLGGAGDTETLTVTRRHPDGRLEDVTADSTWQISEPSVARLDGEIVIGLAVGSADAIATYQGRNATSHVNVVATRALTELSMHPPEMSLGVGDTRGIEVRAHFSDGSVVPVTFVSTFASDTPAVASVRGSGVVGVSPGFAGVTGSHLGYIGAATVAVDPAAGEPMLLITDVQRSGNNVSLHWYCTTPTGVTTPFTVWTRTNLLDGTWQPAGAAVPRHPSGFHTWNGATNGSRAVFYNVTTP